MIRLGIAIFIVWLVISFCFFNYSHWGIIQFQWWLYTGLVLAAIPYLLKDHMQ